MQAPLTVQRLALGGLLAISAVALGVVALRSRAERAAEPEAYQPIRLEEGNAPRHVPAALFGDPPAGSRLVQFQVDGPCCNGCSVTLYDAALAVAGVEKAAVRFDEDAGVALGEVWLEDGVEPEGVAAAVTFDKYAGRIVRPTP